MNKIIIRSNITNEDISCRGQFDSLISENSYDDFLVKLSNLIQKYFENKGSLHGFSVIVQEYIASETIGHLSNERRISERHRGWLIDYEKSMFDAENETFKIFKNRHPGDLKLPKILSSTRFDDINKALHYPAMFVTLSNSIQSRVHFEWVWDKKRVWIVQADNDVHQHGISPEDFMLDFSSNTKFEHEIDLEGLIKVKSFQKLSFNKAKHQLIIEDAGLTPSNLWLIKASDYEDTPKKILTSIEKLLTFGQVVIRTDICGDTYNQKERQNLSRSNGLSHIDSVSEFLNRNIKDLMKNSIPISKSVFLIHNYIPSLSSAFAYASPQNGKVRIDSIWGLPDGLQYYAHDSIEVDTKIKGIVKEKKRFKGYMLGSSKNGDWLPSEICEPFDWRLSIQKKDAIYIANETLKLAYYLRKPVKLMWFVNTPDNSPHPRNVPWYYEEMAIEKFDDYSKGNIYRIDDIKISDENDIEEAKEKYTLEKFNKILLYPKESKIRDNSFLNLVSEFCNHYDITVIFMGSILQHAYYQLKKNNVKVSCLEPFEPVKNNIEYNKLVRDKIAEIIENDGERPIIQQVYGDRLIELLEEKLAEEADEVVSANDRVSKIEEFADLLEVALKLCELEDISIKDILKSRNKKRQTRGGFDKGIFLIKSETKTTIEAEDVSSKFNKKKKSLLRKNIGTQLPFNFDDKK